MSFCCAKNCYAEQEICSLYCAHHQRQSQTRLGIGIKASDNGFEWLYTSPFPRPWEPIALDPDLSLSNLTRFFEQNGCNEAWALEMATRIRKYLRLDV